MRVLFFTRIASPLTSLVFPSEYSCGWFNVELYRNLAPHSDDVWITFMLLLGNEPFPVVLTERSIHPTERQHILGNTALCMLNSQNGYANEQLQNLIRHYGSSLPKKDMSVGLNALIAALTPMQVEGISKVRIGETPDCCYVSLQPSNKTPQVVYSFGEADRVEWERIVTEEYGHEIFLYDNKFRLMTDKISPRYC